MPDDRASGSVYGGDVTLAYNLCVGRQICGSISRTHGLACGYTFGDEVKRPAGRNGVSRSYNKYCIVAELTMNMEQG